MSIEKLTKFKNDIQKLIDQYDSRGLYGPIPYLEEVFDNLDLAIEELEMEEEDCSGERNEI